ALTLTTIVPGVNAGPTGFVTPPIPPATADEVKLSVTAGLNAPEGDADLAIQAQARVGNQDVRSAASVPVVVKPPFTVRLDGPLQLKAGQTVKLAGKVIREAVFEEVVRLTLTGLPAGVTLKPPKPVAANEDVFALELDVGPKVGALTADV